MPIIGRNICIRQTRGCEGLFDDARKNNKGCRNRGCCRGARDGGPHLRFYATRQRPDFELSVATTNADAQGAPIAPGKDSSEALESQSLNSQLTAVKVEPIEEREFPVEKEAVGSIDFNEDMEVQVFTPYQGRIIALFAQVGDDVKKGQTLFTIDSPDLLQAESTLIAAAGVLEMTTRNLARLKELYTTRAVSQRDYDQGISDQQTAEGNLRAGRDAVRILARPTPRSIASSLIVRQTQRS